MLPTRDAYKAILSCNATTDTQANKRFLLFSNGGRGQGIGNIMNGLLAVHLLAIQYNRTCCVSHWNEFLLAFVPENRDICTPLTDRSSRHELSLWNFGPGALDRNCWLPNGNCDLLLKSEEPIIRLSGNEFPFPRFPALPIGTFDKLYRPSTRLLSYIPTNYQMPTTVVHLRVGDNSADKRSGIDVATQNTLIQMFPNTSFIISNNQIINERFKQAGWKAYSSSSGQTHTSLSSNQDVLMKAWRDWYTIYKAIMVYHTPSAFSESAVRASGAFSRRIKGVSPAIEGDFSLLETESETWVVEDHPDG